MQVVGLACAHKFYLMSIEKTRDRCVIAPFQSGTCRAAPNVLAEIMQRGPPELCVLTCCWIWTDWVSSS